MLSPRGRPDPMRHVGRPMTADGLSPFATQRKHAGG